MKTVYTNAERQERQRQREAAAGMKRLTLLVPKSRAAELKAIVKQMRQEATGEAA